MRYYANKSITKDVWYITIVDSARAFTVELTDQGDVIAENVLRGAEKMLAKHLQRIEPNEQFDLTDDPGLASMLDDFQLLDYGEILDEGVPPQGYKDAEK